LLFSDRFFRTAAGSFPPRGFKGRFPLNAATYSTSRAALPIRRAASVSTFPKPGDKQKMATNSSPLTEVLHSENHSKLSSEEIAKALARHNKNHSAAKAENTAVKANKASKK
jgi:hypothetical protein